MVRALFQKKSVFVASVAFLALGAGFFLKDDISSASVHVWPYKQQPVRSLIACAHGVLDESLLSSSVSAVEPAHVRIRFNELPSPETLIFLRENGVIVDQSSWRTDSYAAVTNVNSLCFLAGLPGIVSVTREEYGA